MSILNKFKKYTQTAENLKDDGGISEKEAITRAQKIMKLDYIYILLSTRNANMLKGISVPFICQLEDNRKGLLMFSKEDYAKEYIEKYQHDIYFVY